MAGSWKMVFGVLLLLPLLPLASSSMVFKLGGSVYPTEHLYVTMNIGDTGSSLTWLECDADLPNTCKTCNKLYPGDPCPCRCHTHCTDQHSTSEFHAQSSLRRSALGAPKECQAGPHPYKCDYEINYPDGSSSLGALLLDKFSLPTGSALNIAFGCGNNQMPLKTVPMDGILGPGKGRGSLDLVSQLKRSGAVSKNVIGHCLSTKGGGYLFIGEENVPSSHVTWVPMAPGTPGEHNHYSPGQATLHLGRNSIGTRPLKAIFDSGSTYIVMPERIYMSSSFLCKSPLKEVSDSDTTLPLCWKPPKPFKTVHDLPKEFKSVVSLQFDHGVTMTIPPQNYLIITPHGNACFGILGQRNYDRILIGDITMQEQLVIYDNI